MNLRAYRPDIDGLRAVAVCCVLLFHANFAAFSGGYVGVDVFFVISGYFITLLIAENADKPLKTWLTAFYIRRGRRILPALYATCAIVAIPVAALYLPWDLAVFGKYLAATPVMILNVVEWRQQAGYFNSGATHQPFSHFWSIAVEEQFYFLYPLAFALICRHFSRFKTTALCILGLISFAVCVWGSHHSPSANYFLAPSRAWELILGGILATCPRRLIESAIGSEFIAFLALLTLACAVYSYDAATRYPGWYSLAPCVSSAALISSGNGRATLISRLLSLKPLVFTGLISYSLYLWHLPILMVFSYFNITKLAIPGLAGILVVTFLAAIASWHWIEKPIRSRRIFRSDKSFVICTGATAVVICATGLLIERSGGLPERFPIETRTRGFVFLDNNSFDKQCVTISPARIAAGELCSYGPQDAGATRGLIWGDSHAMALLPAYRELAAARHMRLYFAVMSSCRPLLGVLNKAQLPLLAKKCVDFNVAVESAIRRLDPALIILNAHWIDADGDLVEDSKGPQGQSNFKQGLLGTLQRTASPNRTLCVVLDVPMFAYDVPYALAIARKRGISEDFLKLSRAEATAKYSRAEADVQELETRHLLRSVDPKEILCPGESCLYETSGRLLYRDADHVTPTAAHMLSSVIAGCF